jgi:hypothetical protein
MAQMQQLVVAVGYMMTARTIYREWEEQTGPADSPAR